MRYTWFATLVIGPNKGTDHGAAQCIPKAEIAGADRG